MIFLRPPWFCDASTRAGERIYLCIDVARLERRRDALADGLRATGLRARS